MNDKSVSVKISALEVENVKRVRAVSMTIDANGLTVIGGKNAQGKSSVLDAIMWTLGGDRYRPSTPIHEGAEKVATRIELSNGIVAERRGQGTLKVTDTTGKRGGAQKLLDEFVSSFALDLPKFMQASAADKAQMLLNCFPGLGAELESLNREVKSKFDERHGLGVICERKRKYALELPHNNDAPNELLSGSEMTQRLQDKLRVNAENDRLRREVSSLRTEQARQISHVKKLRAELVEEDAKLATLTEQLARSETVVASRADEDTASLQSELERIDTVNSQVRANLDKARAEAEANELAQQYEALTSKIEDIRAKRIALLSKVEMPLTSLTIDDEGQLLFRERRWDGMSGAEQLRVAVAICAKIKPACGFVLLDGLERMDIGQLHEFAAWLEAQNLQAIGTRVSTGDECSIVIEDGVVVGADEPPEYDPSSHGGRAPKQDFKFD